MSSSCVLDFLKTSVPKLLYRTVYGLLQESFWNKKVFDFLSYSGNGSFARVPRLPSWSEPRPYGLPCIPFIFLDGFFDHGYDSSPLYYLLWICM